MDEVRTLLDSRCMLHLGKEAKDRIAKCRNYLDERMKNQKAPIYGVTTGFGSLCNVSVDKDQLSQLQKNLVMSHACGVGEEVRPEIVRLMIALKVKSLSYGYSGVRVETVERLVDLRGWWISSTRELLLSYTSRALLEHPETWHRWQTCACRFWDWASLTTMARDIPAASWRVCSDGSL